MTRDEIAAGMRQISLACKIINHGMTSKYNDGPAVLGQSTQHALHALGSFHHNHGWHWNSCGKESSQSADDNQPHIRRQTQSAQRRSLRKVHGKFTSEPARLVSHTRPHAGRSYNDLVSGMFYGVSLFCMSGHFCVLEEHAY